MYPTGEIKKLLYQDLTYKIRKIVFAIRNNYGPGHKEIICQRLFRENLKREAISFDKKKELSLLRRRKINRNISTRFCNRE